MYLIFLNSYFWYFNLTYISTYVSTDCDIINIYLRSCVNVHWPMNSCIIKVVKCMLVFCITRWIPMKVNNLRYCSQNFRFISRGTQQIRLTQENLYGFWFYKEIWKKGVPSYLLKEWSLPKDGRHYNFKHRIENLKFQIILNHIWSYHRIWNIYCYF